MKHKIMKKRGLSLFLVFTLLLGFSSFIVPGTAAAAESMELTVDTATAMPKNTVQVSIRLANNPGLASLKLDVAYDSFLTLETVVFDTAFGAYVLAPTPYTNPQTLSFISPLEEVGTDGIFATLTFLVSEEAPDNYEAKISVDCDEENTFDGDLAPVSVTARGGAVNIIHGIPGDIDGDRKVNNKDAILLFRYVAGGDVAVDEFALDVNCDGRVNNKDAITLFRYVAGWDVQIGRGDPCDFGHKEIEIPAVAPTCTEGGSTAGKKCSVCEKITVEPESIPELGHDYVDGICTRCEDEDENAMPDVPLVSSQGLTFTSNGDGTCYVSGIGTCEDVDVVIPSVSPEGDKVTGIGESAFLYSEGVMSITIPDGVLSIADSAFEGCWDAIRITIPDSVTSIGNYAFSECASLTGIVIGNGVKSIGDNAFFWCRSLSSITVPDSVTSIGDSAFYECNNLTSVTMGNGVRSVGSSAFYGCKNLTSVTMENGVTSIGPTAFYECESLTSITIPDGVTTIDSGTFYGCKNLPSITIPNGVTSIAGSAFMFCESLTSVTLPDSLTNIGGCAFYDCKSLESIAIPDNVANIGESAFFGCISLLSITVSSKNSVYHSDGNCLIETAAKNLVLGCVNSVIPTDGSVTSIGYSAFKNCDSLTNIAIPNGVTSIGSCAFYGCKSLQSITIPDSVTSIGENAFLHCDQLIQEENGVYYVDRWVIDCDPDVDSIVFRSNTEGIADMAFSQCANLKSITIPNGVASIGDYAFHNCDSLTSITIPNGVTSIGGSAFYGCESLQSITIPDSVTSIGDSSFAQCDRLRSITIPDSVTTIGSHAFSGCENLANVTIPRNVTSIESGTFQRCYSLKSIIIPDSVTSIGYEAFYNCYNLTSVTIGNGVTLVETSAFAYCFNLTEVTFRDTCSKWETIQIKSGNDCLLEATIHCTNGDIPPES